MVVPLDLASARELRGALAHLGHRAGRRGQRLGVDGLDRIDRRTTAGRSASIVARIFSSWISAITRTCAAVEAEPARAQRHLGAALLAGDVEHLGGARQRVERLQQQRRLADARVAADQHHAAGDDAAAEHAVELVDAGRLRGRRRRPRSPTSVATDSAGRQRRATGLRSDSAAAPSATASTSVFQASQCGHLPCHFGLVPPHSVQV